MSAARVEFSKSFDAGFFADGVRDFDAIAFEVEPTHTGVDKFDTTVVEDALEERLDIVVDSILGAWADFVDVQSLNDAEAGVFSLVELHDLIVG